MTFVYFIRTQNYVKIGITQNLDARLCTLQIGCSQPLTVIAAIPGTRSLEKKLHRRFVGTRLHGEWFIISPEIEAYLTEVA